MGNCPDARPRNGLAPLRADAFRWNVTGAAMATESTAIRATHETEGRNLQNFGVRLLTREAINEFGDVIPLESNPDPFVFFRHSPRVNLFARLGAERRCAQHVA
jgi:hypothetical protein